MALTMLLLLLFIILLLVMLMRRLEDCFVGIYHSESETRNKPQTVCLFSPLLHLLPLLTSPLVAIFVIGVIVVSPLGMGLIRLTKIHHQDIALVAIMTVFFVLAGAMGALSVLYHSTDTLQEVLSVPVHLLSTLSTYPLPAPPP
jgi:uncharacterized BrkB/YihY/UPF0761 family membrane protein